MTEDRDPKTSSGKLGKALKPVKEHWWAALGLAFGFIPLLIDLRKGELTSTGVFGAFIGTIFFLIDVVTSATASEAKVSEKLDRVISEKLKSVENAVDNNTRVLKAHEQLLSSRTTDQLMLIAFK